MRSPQSSPRPDWRSHAAYFTMDIPKSVKHPTCGGSRERLGDYSGVIFTHKIIVYLSASSQIRAFPVNHTRTWSFHPRKELRS